MKEVRMGAVVDATKCTGCNTCIHVCPTMAYTPPEERPIERHMLPPCQTACPAGIDIEGFVSLAHNKKWDEALHLLRKTNPLPGVTGRVCPAPCERACNRNRFDESVSIRALERAVADYASPKSQDVLTSRVRYRERVAIIGSGPAGLSCAYHLTRNGFSVTVFEQKSAVGGALRYAIPTYRLSKDVLDREVAYLEELGIEFKLNQKWGDRPVTEALENYDAIYLALGFQKSQELGIPGENRSQVMTGLTFLEQVNSGRAPKLGHQVLIIGGGNVAVDSARSVLRLKAKPKLVFHGRERDMAAISSKVKELKGEGVHILSLTKVVRFVLKDGQLAEVECVKMERAKGEGDRQWTFVPIPGSEFIVPADIVINGIGEIGDIEGASLGFEVEGGKILADRWGRTSVPKLFAGGDISTGRGTVVHAIGSGRRGAQAIAAYLHSESNMDEPSKKRVVSAAKLNFDYCDPVPSLTTSRISMERAISCFDEIHKTPTKKESISETDRCLHCGVIPDFKPEYCLGCDNCSSRCPSFAISLKELESPYVVKVDIEEKTIEKICQICENAVIHPESIVCQCTGTRANEIVAAILKGAKTVIDIRRWTGAHSGCGSACISPIFQLMRAAGLQVGSPPQPDLYYPSLLTIWDIPDRVVRDFEARGFRFKEDKDFFKNWLDSIRNYSREKA